MIRFKHAEHGQALLLAALAFVLLIGALGLAIDGANAFGQRRRIANATDAAALAASRELIAVQRDSGDGSAINSVIRDFLTGRHGITADQISFSAFYVARENPDLALAAVTDGVLPPTDADGVQVSVTFAFDTYFMGAFGLRELSVGTTGTAVYGPLGTAIGQDLAPLAISVTGLEIIKRHGTVNLDVRGYLAEEVFFSIVPITLPDNVISEADIKHVSFRNVAGAPVTGDDCASTTPTETLTYWWCNGSPNQLRINRELPDGTPTWNRLFAAADWRRANRPLIVLPVYADVGYYQLVNFVALELVQVNQTTGVIRARHVENYATAGAMVGDGSGVETGVWAVNLTR
jgi:Flp pilus assembly protein TadG